MRNLQTGDAPLAQVGEREIMRMIMDYPGVDVNIANFAGYTPLFEAMGNGHPEVVELMLNHEDTKLDIITSDGEIALHTACRSRHAYCVRFFLNEKRCTTSIVNKQSSYKPDPFCVLHMLEAMI